MNISELRELISTTLSERKYSNKTVQAYLHWINDIHKYYSNIEPSELDEVKLNEYLEHLKNKRKLALATIRQANNAIKFTYNNLLQKDYTFRKYTSKWSDRPQLEVPSQSEVFRILENINEERNKLPISLLYGTGVDLSEVLRIKVRDINFKNKTIKITLNRNKGLREVIIPDVLLDDLKAISETADKDDFIFSDDGINSYHPTRLQKAFSRSVKKLGIKKVYSLKSLRYAYVKHLELFGVPLVNTLKFMELSKIASLEFYSRIGITDLSVTFSPLDRKISSVEEQNRKIESYVSEKRIKELSNLGNDNFDLTRLIQLLIELNTANRNLSFMTIAILLRAIIDHVPPLFDLNTFNEVTSNYRCSKSFKSSMLHLNKSLRNVADTFLHLRLRKKEILPTFNQVDFRSDLDMLLSEIIRVNKS